MRESIGNPLGTMATPLLESSAANGSRRPVNDTHRMLPLLARMCAGVDEIFVEFVGPFGEMLTTEARTAWLGEGNKMRSSDIEGYIALLARQIDDVARRTQFVQRAREHAGVAHLQPHS